MILGDNGDIYRLVGAYGSATVDANGAGQAARSSFLTFNYDISSYDASELIIPRGVDAPRLHLRRLADERPRARPTSAART